MTNLFRPRISTKTRQEMIFPLRGHARLLTKHGWESVSSKLCLFFLLLLLSNRFRKYIDENTHKHTQPQPHPGVRELHRISEFLFLPIFRLYSASSVQGTDINKYISIKYRLIRLFCNFCYLHCTLGTVNQ